MEIGSLLAVVHVLHAQQVHVMFRARLPRPEFGIGPESLEVDLFEPGRIPWPELAFPSARYALERYLDDLATGRESMHFTAIDRRLPVGTSLGSAAPAVAK